MVEVELVVALNMVGGYTGKLKLAGKWTISKFISYIKWEMFSLPC